MRNAALEHVRELQRRYDDLVPQRALAEGFRFRGRRVSFGSFYSGIFRAQGARGTAALCLVTAPPKSGWPPPYDDEFDEETDRFTYRFRAPKTPTPAARLQAAADKRAELAHAMAVAHMARIADVHARPAGTPGRDTLVGTRARAMQSDMSTGSYTSPATAASRSR